jgi:hypothetical protein
MRISSSSDAASMEANYTPQRDTGCPPAVEERSGTVGQESLPTAAEATSMQPPQEEMEARLAALPKEVGVLLVTIGAMGVVLPGIVGTPALLAGGLLLWPRGFRSVNGWLQRKCPKIHRHGAAQLIRYLDDLERRYPTSTHRG